MAEETEKVIALDGRRTKQAPEDARTLSQKWGKDTMAANYTVIPCALLRGQARLHIGPNELAVLIHLIDHWWRPDAMPWPSKQTHLGTLMPSGGGPIIRAPAHHTTTL